MISSGDAGGNRTRSGPQRGPAFLSRVTKTLVAAAGPFFSVINPQQDKLYVSNSRDTTVAVIDIPSLTVLQEIPDVGSSPFDLVFSP